MADYWVSQPRKFCDFCKCWIADNKPSRDFHEKGKKHAENVKRKLAELRKKGTADFEKAEEDRRAMQEMEEKALAAFKKDIMANPSLAAQYGVKLKSKDEDTNEDAAKRPESEDNESEDTNEDSVNRSESEDDESEEEEAKDDDNAPENWYEAQSPEGYTYYWNTITQESRWVKPEGYTSPADRLKANDDSTSTKKTDSTPRKRKTASKDSSEKVSTLAHQKSTKTQAESKQESSTPIENMASTTTNIMSMDDIANIALPPEVPNTSEEGATSQSAYGQWETVQTEPEEPVDLQLPVSKSEETTAVVVIKEPKMKFREKKVTSLSGGLFNKGPTGFKKRKLNPTASFNLRKRVDI